jgi:molybdopterin molybdotransferase
MALMLSYRDALQLVLDRALPAEPVLLPPLQALGLVAARDILALDPVPPFSNSAMDGFGLRAADAAGASVAAPVRLRVMGAIPAGRAECPPLEAQAAFRIMTGAPVPSGVDTVVPIEDVTRGEDWVQLTRPPRLGANIRLAGEDIAGGGLVVRAGTELRPAEIGVLATIGCVAIPVRPRPRVAVLTTGNELVDAGDRPGPGRIRDANIHSLCAQVAAAGAIPLPFARVEDRRETVRAALAEALAAADVVLTNGGISVGDFDYLKEVLEELGAERVFWRVAQKPGAPLGLWLLEGKLVFGIPGNPVAAMLMFEEYVRPALRKLMGYPRLHRPERKGTLAAPWRKSGADGRLHFLRVLAKAEGAGFRAELTGPQGSGVLSSMMRANALVLVPEDTLAIAEGGEVLLHFLDEAEDH